MNFTDSLLVAIFTMLVVFSVLALLFVIIRVFSFAIGKFTDRETAGVPQMELPQKPAAADSVPTEEEVFSSGTLKLKNVDEPTAAMIMAIVSDESGIPLSELCFKSIKLISK